MSPSFRQRIRHGVLSRLFTAGVILLVSSGPSCKQPIRGEFGWASTDDRGIDEPEKSLLLETEFRLTRQNIYFFDYETIWWIYRFRSGGLFSSNANQFLAVLYENNGTPEPLELDTRHVQVLKEGTLRVIQQYYEPLKPGNYILKIAQGSNVVDQVSFEVVPADGPAAIHPEDELDTDENSADQPENRDEILKYSGGADPVRTLSP